MSNTKIARVDGIRRLSRRRSTDHRTRFCDRNVTRGRIPILHENPDRRQALTFERKSNERAEVWTTRGPLKSLDIYARRPPVS